MKNFSEEKIMNSESIIEILKLNPKNFIENWQTFTEKNILGKIRRIEKGYRSKKYSFENKINEIIGNIDSENHVYYFEQYKIHIKIIIYDDSYDSTTYEFEEVFPVEKTILIFESTNIEELEGKFDKIDKYEILHKNVSYKHSNDDDEIPF